jgi:hypothetical protein
LPSGPGTTATDTPDFFVDEANLTYISVVQIMGGCAYRCGRRVAVLLRTRRAASGFMLFLNRNSFLRKKFSLLHPIYTQAQ